MMREIPRRIRLWFRKKQDIFVEILSIFVWGMFSLIALVLYLCKLIDIVAFVSIIIGLIFAFLPLYNYLIKKRDQTILISFTSKYLLEEQEDKVDELLGILIAGKWRKLKIDPIEEFFKCLKKLSIESGYEMKRRIAEALPALYRIDIEESKDIVKILRRDWDDEWKSDNRRRTIESLSCILNKDKKFARENIHIIENDEIYSTFASVETLDVWRTEFSKKEAESIFSELKKELKGQNYSEDEIIAVNELWNILDVINIDVNEAIKKIEELKNSKNIFIQIVIARNLKHFCKRFPEKTLNLMDYFLKTERHKNVRRPIAKEDSVECLINLLEDKKVSQKAKEVVWKLINDDDDIIRIATFDRIEKILNIDRTFGRDILKHIIKRNKHTKLVERANNLSKREGF